MREEGYGTVALCGPDRPKQMQGRKKTLKAAAGSVVIRARAGKRFFLAIPFERLRNWEKIATSPQLQAPSGLMDAEIHLDIRDTDCKIPF